jgi:hypothetical protein
MTDGLRARGAYAGFAAAPLTRAELAAMPFRPISEALCLAAAAELSAATASPQSPAATGAQVSGQGALAADRPSASAQGNAAGASHADDASANHAIGSSVECRSKARGIHAQQTR